jgi:hypothetical protein
MAATQVRHSGQVMIGLASKTAMVRVSCRLRFWASTVRKTALGMTSEQPVSTSWDSNFWLAFSWTMRWAFAAAAIAKVFFDNASHRE